MSFVGFTYFKDESVKEYLPDFNIYETKQQKRLLALEFINGQLNKEIFDVKSTQTDLDLFQIIFSKTVELATITPNRSCPGCGCEISSLMKVMKFFDYFDLEYDETKLLKSDICTASKIINGLEIENDKIELKVDMRENFNELVLKKMIHLNKDKIVVKKRDRIEIRSEKSSKFTIIIPQWDKVKPDGLHELNGHIADAGKKFSNNCSSIYLIYPQTENFNKQIKILHTGIKSDQEIKVTPYYFQCYKKEMAKSHKERV
ncbi:MAG: hypothetical protein OIF32_11935 [Campylobacterales bacterium]|nr:hypothetical protein [Campylobacterales bacterium]